MTSTHRRLVISPPHLDGGVFGCDRSLAPAALACAVERPAAPIAGARASPPAQAETMRAYASQVALFAAHALVDLHAPETCRRLQCETMSA
ncbi:MULTISPECIES: hypothetical protein [unclassified Burkholderia]|uniref:hypothetical protein n=1 Tax=unclassified Burkholderia TaxID=2613784 RepID=UPI0007527B0D|nr:MULTISPECIES: hypothetical protein [unclassified Burkholderia]KVN03195.1 hypothetical protein WT08_24040 [Burkholderia sp. MSMB1552]KWZ49854.1 hypothetical protein WS92_20520 [Burkholderia sp. MSMB1588]